MVGIFDLGQVVATKGIHERMQSDEKFRAFVSASMHKYRGCDWGDTCREDSELNDDSVGEGERILAVYTYKETGESIWIITEWDRSVTTILFPSEY